MKHFADVDAYIAAAAEEARPHLEALRTLVRSTVPEAEEAIWYGVPFYRHHGELVGFDAYTHHVSFGIGAAALGDAPRARLEEQGYETLKATVKIRFDQELPTALLAQLLREKARANEASAS
jgi:uncharacterized protein YdhG (YjbR/CyaY superfamily)